MNGYPTGSSILSLWLYCVTRIVDSRIFALFYSEYKSRLSVHWHEKFQNFLYFFFLVLLCAVLHRIIVRISILWYDKISVQVYLYPAITWLYFFFLILPSNWVSRYWKLCAVLLRILVRISILWQDIRPGIYVSGHNLTLFLLLNPTL